MARQKVEQEGNAIDTILLLLSTPDDLWSCNNILTGLYQILTPELDITSASAVDLCITDASSLNLLQERLSDHENGSAAPPPVILVASANAFDDLDQELLAGVDDIITRPIQPAELAIRLRRQLQGGGRAKQRIRFQGTHYGSKTRSVHPVEDDQWYNGLFVSHHIVMLLLDPANGSILDANPAACNYYGWSREAFLLLNISDISTLPVEKSASR